MLDAHRREVNFVAWIALAVSPLSNGQKRAIKVEAAAGRPMGENGRQASSFGLSGMLQFAKVMTNNLPLVTVYYVLTNRELKGDHQ
jgi:hypothetical protein